MVVGVRRKYTIHWINMQITHYAKVLRDNKSGRRTEDLEGYGVKQGGREVSPRR